MSKMQKIKLRLNQLKIIFLIYFFKCFSFLSSKEHWIISERGCDARDNGYFFYRFLKTNHPEIKVYYLISKQSADFFKVKEDAIEYGSIKSFWLVTTCKKLISSHYALTFPYMQNKIFKICGLHKKFYFLQHGIINNDLPYLYQDSAPMRLFVCGAKPEFDYIRERFGHEETVVQYTGLARYDNLLDYERKEQILLMPTWRQYLKTEEDFLASQYYENFLKLINDAKLIKRLEEENIDMVFYPHYEVQKWIKHFTTQSDRIKIASFEQYDVQTLLKESALLITDYSSVFFDFAYMNKPMIYFQFDREQWAHNHYLEGYFDHRIMGFGPVCETISQVVESVFEYISLDMKQKIEYKKRIEGFFPVRDENNCERIYNAIVRE